ncbi:MAG: hypothetical protein IJF73_06655 [Clostridia bacterium]|nr:hypothetical protein [Clostridia bacterium]
MRLSYLFSECLAADYVTLAGGVDYAAKRRDGVLSLFFEASDGAADWRKNLDFPAAAYRRHGRTVFSAHRGFLSAWRVAEAAVAPLLADPTLTGITLVGYSHGAAIAVLSHEYVWYHRPDLRPRLTGYGFGCPRVVFGGAARRLAERWERFTVVRNLDDLVTHLPPAVLGYRHVGRLLEVGERGRYSATDAHRPENLLAELLRAERKGSRA